MRIYYSIGSALFPAGQPALFCQNCDSTGVLDRCRRPHACAMLCALSGGRHSLQPQLQRLLPEGSEYDDDQPPLCQSFDGKVGYGEPGGTCADCVLNQFGSDGNNKGKACKNMRMLYLLRSGEYMPIQIALPPTSLTPYTRFVNEAFLSRRRKVCTGVVRIGLKKAVSGSHEYCVATFTKIADFAGEDLAHIRAYADGFVAQIKDINAQRAQAGAAASNIIGDGDASHLELPDNGAHFALGAVIDGEREELPA